MSQHLPQLLAACLDLKATIDAALVAADLAPLVHMLPSDEDSKTGSNDEPRVVVTLASGRQRRRLGIGDTRPVLDSLEVTFDLQLDGPESEVLAYEGVLIDVLAGARSTVRSAVTAGAVDAWELTDGSLSRNEGRRNTKGSWSAKVAVAVTVQWE